MAARVVTKSRSTMVVGIDPHNGLYYLHAFTGQSIPPKPPLPIPGMPQKPDSYHGVMATADWASLDDKSNPTVLANGKPVVSQDHAAKRTVHVPPGGNLPLPLIILFASSTWKLSVGSVIAANGPLASTLAGSFGLTLDCADPVSMPTGAYWSETTVHIAPTASDLAAFGIGWAKQAALEIIFVKISNAAADAMKPILRNLCALAARKLGGSLFSKFGKEATTKAIAEGAAKSAAKEATERMIDHEGKDLFVDGLRRSGQLSSKREADALGQVLRGEPMPSGLSPSEAIAVQQGADGFKASKESAGSAAANATQEASEGAVREASEGAATEWFRKNGKPNPTTSLPGDQTPGSILADATEKAEADAAQKHWGAGYPADAVGEVVKSEGVDRTSGAIDDALGPEKKEGAP